MKIITENLQMCKKIFDKTKSNTNPYYEYIYLNFDKKYLQFMNETTIVRVALKIEDFEKHDNFFVHGNKFLFLIENFEYLILSGTTFYSPEGNKFTLPIMEEELEIDLNDSDMVEETITFTKDFNSLIRLAIEYTDKDLSSPFSAIFLDRGKLMVLSDTKFFNADISKTTTSTFVLPLLPAKIITSLAIEDNVLLRTKKTSNDNYIIEFVYKDLIYKFTSSSNYSLPVDPFDPEFIASFTHENFFILNNDEMMNTLILLLDYLKDSLSTHCKIKFFTLDEEGNSLENSYLKLYLQVDGEITYKTLIKSTSNDKYFEGQEFWISLESMKKAISSIISKNKDEMIKIKYDENEPSVMFTSENSDSIYIVQSLLDKNEME